MSILKLFLIFIKIGAILLGGGYVILPILINEFSEKHCLISEEEIVEYFSISQTLPGIIAVNMSVFIGHKIRGKLGAFISLLGLIFAPFLSIVFLSSILNKISGNNIIISALGGISIAVIVLISQTVREMWEKSKKNIFFYFLYAFALVSLIIFKLSPICTILFFTIFGIILKKFLLKCEVNK